jgi:hypothetical protein
MTHGASLLMSPPQQFRQPTSQRPAYLLYIHWRRRLITLAELGVSGLSDKPSVSRDNGLNLP